MIQYYDSRAVDLWWEGVSQTLDKSSLESHSLTKELIKYQILLGNWILFKGDQCVYVGHFTFTDRKQFFITMVAGKNLKNEIYEFLDYIRDQYNCNSFSGLNDPGLGRLYKRWLSSIGNVRYLNHYVIDVVNYPYNASNISVKSLTLFDIDKWYDRVYNIMHDVKKHNSSLSRDIILNQVVNGQLYIYEIGDSIIIGNLSNNLCKKIFYITYVQDTITETQLADFFYFVEIEMFCRYVCYFDCPSSPMNLITLDNSVIRKQLTIFERNTNEQTDFKRFIP